MFTKCLVSSLSCSSEYFSAFSFESKTLSLPLALPKMNGFELYHNIRKLDDRVKICFLTAGEMYYEDIRKQVFPELEANCFIIKPIANEDLIRKVKNLLGIQ